MEKCTAWVGSSRNCQIRVWSADALRSEFSASSWIADGPRRRRLLPPLMYPGICSAICLRLSRVSVVRVGERSAAPEQPAKLQLGAGGELGNVSQEPGEFWDWYLSFNIAENWTFKENVVVSFLFSTSVMRCFYRTRVSVFSCEMLQCFSKVIECLWNFLLWI